MHAPSIPERFRNRLSRPGLSRLLRIAGWTLFGVYFAFGLLLLTLRYGILPRIEDYRGDIEAAVSKSLKRPVALGAVEAGWNGLRPRLDIHGLEIRDAQNRPALGFDNVQAELSWASLWHFGLRLHRFEIVAPTLDIRRDAEGRLFVAGLELATDTQDDGFTDWLLAQERIVIRDAAIRWHDEQRDAPPLALEKLNFDLRNDGARHRFGFTAEPPPELATRLDVRGDFKGRDLDLLEAWKGEAYAELDYADLAGWRAWVDYPVELPRGTGALRLWLGFAHKELNSLTADLRLADVQLRLASDLPMLELAQLGGRFAARRSADVYEAEAKKLELSTRDGVRIEPTDFRLRFHPAAANKLARGEFVTGGVDLGAVAALASHLPFDNVTRKRLAAFAPRGRIKDFRATWTGMPGDLQQWNVKGEFAELGLAAQGVLPGFAGLSGSVEGDEKGGRLTLASLHAEMELPAVFADPRLNLEALNAQMNWKAKEGGAIDIQLDRVAFHNRDAAGEASGRYRLDPEGPGAIDLTAKLTRGSGAAVWRYMPLAVNRNVRDWLHASIAGGQADEATLRLKGDLAKFPFKDGKDGIFQVKGRFRGATLNYAQGWPGIDNIEGELLFEGVRMLITGHKGSILGVGVGPVTAEIPDLETSDELLIVNGRAAGPTADFLRFIEASPVGERIDHFTEDMSAAGSGELQLKLVMPLQRLSASKVEGRYRFANNRLVPDPGLPPFTEVNGELRFTGDKLEANKVRGNLLGAPMTADIVTLGDGNVGVKAAGSFSVAALRKQFDHPLLGALSGTTNWTGSVRVKKKNVDLRIESTLSGIASSLPEPFNKTTNDNLPLVFERRAGTGGRDRIDAALGEVLRMQLVQRHEGASSAIERGSIGIGMAPPRLPERGIAVGLQAPRVDLDAWRRLFARNGNGAAGGGDLPISQVNVVTDSLTVFDREIAGLRLAATRSGSLWKADVKSRDVAGHIEWNGEGAGRVSGRLSQLSIPDAAAAAANEALADMPSEMPAIDLVADRFLLRGKDFGELKVKAENDRDGIWRARLDIRNEDGNLSGEGRWRPSTTAPETRLDFKLGAKSVEKMLARVGYPDAVRRTTASLEGNLAWSGVPFAIDYPSLAGRIKFEARDGQFNKLEPGVGRLLGVLSMQALPRRLILDFRDVFSEGFLFDAIAGEATVTRGIMETRDLQIHGPAAKVSMAGSVNLSAETQDLKMRVQPTVGDTVATGVLLAHPVTGVTAWVLNKILGNPLDQAFAFEYAVTGGWADPKVEKLGGPREAPKEIATKEAAGKDAAVAPKEAAKP